MDIASYLLGKSKGGGGEQPVLITKNINENGTYNASDDEADGYSKVNVNVEADLSEYFNNSSTSNRPRATYFLKKFPAVSISNNATNLAGFFDGCQNMVEIELFDTSRATGLNSFCTGCSKLEIVPLFNTSNVRVMISAFSSCPKLTDTSLDNILQMCINATSYTEEKTLTRIGIVSSNYPASRIQALPHYQDFINAGWTIGYE